MVSPYAPAVGGPPAPGFDSSQISRMEEEAEGEAFDDIELFEDDLEAEAAKAEQDGEYKEAPTRKRRATVTARCLAAAQGTAASAAGVALSMSEAIVQAAIANGRAGLSRG